METFFLKKNVKLKKIPPNSFKKNILKSKFFQQIISPTRKSKTNTKNDYKWTGVMTQAAFLLKTLDIKTSTTKTFAGLNEEAFFYIKDSNLHKFKEVVEKKQIDLEAVDCEGNTMLNIAVLSNNYEIACYLLELGANVNSINVSSFS